MGTKYKSFICYLWKFLMLATINTISQSYVEGLRTLDKNIFGLKPKGTIKTIEALEVGDIIDCVNIYKQPAFDNPIIKDLKMAPSSYKQYPVAFNKTSDPQPKLIQAWTKYGECPKGTIPIRRTSNNNVTAHQKYSISTDHEYASVIQKFNKGHGAKAAFNVWNPQVKTAEEFSLSQMWVVSGQGRQLNTVEAGWMVYPELFHDARTRLFIYWSRNKYKKGCYNLICSGFVQTNYLVALGVALEPISIYDGLSSNLVISLSRSNEGDWWLGVNGILVGYFPRQLIKTLGDGADAISFGGEIINLEIGGRHTTTAMGSGLFSGGGFKKASYISNIRVIDEKLKWVEPNMKIHHVSKRGCYDLSFGPPETNMGSHFYFGGPWIFSTMSKMK